MYVIADIEWVTSCDGTISPVQLAAVRVDEGWNQIDFFCSFIKPLDNTFDDWTQVAFNGVSPEDFQNANNAADVIFDFLQWLDYDTLLWWLDQSKVIFFKLVAVFGGQQTSKGNKYKRICV